MLLMGVGGAKVKSVQAGIAELVASASVATVSISPVDLGRAVLIMHTASVSGSSSPGAPDDFFVTGKLSSPTAIELRRYGTSGYRQIAWTVVEFASGVSVQPLSVNVLEARDVTIAPVDVSKAFLILTFRTSHATDSFANASRNTPLATLVNETTVHVERRQYTDSTFAEIQVVEVR